jgi:hypothetical protein
MRQRLLPPTAGDMQAWPVRVAAPQRWPACIAAVLRSPARLSWRDLRLARRRRQRIRGRRREVAKHSGAGARGGLRATSAGVQRLLSPGSDISRHTIEAAMGHNRTQAVQRAPERANQSGANHSLTTFAGIGFLDPG